MTTMATPMAGPASAIRVDRIVVGTRVITASDIAISRCYIKLKTVSQRWINDNEGHCARRVTWAVDTPSGILFMCSVDFDKYMEKNCIDPSRIRRLSDNERDFNESHPGAGVRGRKRK